MRESRIAIPGQRKTMIQSRFVIAVCALLALASSSLVHADDDAIEALRAHIEAIDPGFEVDDIRTTGVDGLYEVVSGANVIYMTGDGDFLLRGQLIDLENDRNLTAERRRELVQRVVDALGEDSMLVYPPKNGSARHTITVFTDTTCPYCRQLHQGLLEMIERYPVKVRYLMFPREGLQARAADTLEDVWCAPDPRQAMTDAKADRNVPASDADCETSIEDHFRVAREIGVNGTPYMLIDDDGPIVPGYRPNDELLKIMGLEAGSGG